MPADLRIVSTTPPANAPKTAWILVRGDRRAPLLTDSKAQSVPVKNGWHEVIVPEPGATYYAFTEERYSGRGLRYDVVERDRKLEPDDPNFLGYSETSPA